MSVYPVPVRAAELDRRLYSQALTDPDRSKRYQTDVQFHWEIDQLRNLLKRADKAMEIEGVDRRVRDRVAHWLIYGEPPPDPDEDSAVISFEPDWPIR